MACILVYVWAMHLHVNTAIILLKNFSMMEGVHCKEKKESGIILKLMSIHHLVTIIRCYGLGRLSDQQNN